MDKGNSTQNETQTNKQTKQTNKQNKNAKIPYLDFKRAQGDDVLGQEAAQTA